ncbi:fucose 4-O-acetylase-like acetyltransferase [Mesobacillus foraminis]|uniref:Fucose 4-O-acetylase-like acetyltransferase n=1 Tax=Mesobacillus foraminis TaxID=279826 RepID=A0A4R2BHZ5_9BACI|nr:fucose 4-O-acetylase-like acetyltransferase [Mesobacillus foraminis]
MKLKRIPWFDNIKGLLIFLVVFGHAIEVYRHTAGNESVKYLYDVIYFFHMPLFIIISGYFYRPNKFDRVVKLLSVFFIWQLVHGILSKLIKEQAILTLTPEGRIFSIFEPYWTMWYLLGIVVWSVVTPYFLKLKHPVLISIGLALLISYAENVTGWFSLRKLVNFYPYFLIGYLLSEKQILHTLSEKAKGLKSPVRWTALAVLLVYLGGMLYYTQIPKGTEFLFMRESYSYFEWSFIKGAAFHVALYGLVVLLSISLFFLVPMNKKIPFFNHIGIYSVFVYLIHTNIIRVFRPMMPEEAAKNPALVISVGLLFALVLCWAVSLPIVRAVFKPLVEPSLNWLFKKDDTTSADGKIPAMKSALTDNGLTESK